MRALTFLLLFCISNIGFSNKFTDKIKNFDVCNAKGPRSQCKSAQAALACLEKKYAKSYTKIKEKLDKGRKIHFFFTRDRLFAATENQLQASIDDDVILINSDDPNCFSQLNHQKIFVEKGKVKFEKSKTGYMGQTDKLEQEEKQDDGCIEPQEIKLSQWMEQFQEELGLVKFFDLAIPGSHDAATSEISTSSKVIPEGDIPEWINYLKYLGVGFAVNKVIANWSKAQKLSIYDQLAAGVRYLDIRLFKNKKGAYWTEHTFAGEPFDALLKQIKRFLEENPKEIIAIDLQSIHLSDYDDVLHEKIMEYLGDFKFATGDDIQKPLNNLWNENKRIFMFLDSADQRDTRKNRTPEAINRNQYLVSHWPNASTREEFETKMIPYFDQFDPADKRFTIIQAQLTPSTDSVVDGITKPWSNPSSLKELADDWEPYIQRHMPAWLDITGGAVIMRDFSEPHFSEKIVAYNIKRHNKLNGCTKKQVRS